MAGPSRSAISELAILTFRAESLFDSQGFIHILKFPRSCNPLKKLKSSLTISCNVRSLSHLDQISFTAFSCCLA